ncbi:hypothetical protein LINPERHAP1_LOCUS37473 [Linum perenne]
MMNSIPPTASSGLILHARAARAAPAHRIKYNKLEKKNPRTERAVKASAAKPGGFSFNSILGKCRTCGGKSAIECPGCKGSGKNKKNGNMFERWNVIRCFDCQGFGMKSCPSCGDGVGLTPEQRGER